MAFLLNENPEQDEVLRCRSGQRYRRHHNPPIPPSSPDYDRHMPYLPHPCLPNPHDLDYDASSPCQPDQPDNNLGSDQSPEICEFLRRTRDQVYQESGGSIDLYNRQDYLRGCPKLYSWTYSEDGSEANTVMLNTSLDKYTLNADDTSLQIHYSRVTGTYGGLYSCNNDLLGCVYVYGK